LAAVATGDADAAQVRVVCRVAAMPLSHHPGTQQFELASCGVLLPAQLLRPAQAEGLVIFVHGSGSSRLSSRNQAVATVLQQAGLATVLFDLLTAAEQNHAGPHRQPAPDLELLARRLLGVIDGLCHRPDLAELPLGLFGSSSGAAIALQVASDLVPAALGDVCCPTLLLVGSHDLDVLELNTWAAARLQGLHELRVVPGAGHLFVEPGALDQVAALSRDWFLRHLPC
jgi:putative phosphoribosyl transferase